MTEEHFEKAAVCSAANALQISGADDCTELHGEIAGVSQTPEKQRKNGPLHRDAAICKEPFMGDEGLEATSENPGKTGFELTDGVLAVASAVAIRRIPDDLLHKLRGSEFASLLGDVPDTDRTARR